MTNFPPYGALGNSGGRFQFRGSESSLTYSETDSPPPSPTQSQQAANLREYVIDTLCFGDTTYCFDMNFKAFSASQISERHIRDKEQKERVDHTFGPKRKDQRIAPARTNSTQRIEQPAAGSAATSNTTLLAAIDRLNTRKPSNERTAEAISLLSNASLVEEKRNLKQGLRSFDVLFERVMGRQPEKCDKEPLRTVYGYYKDLKKEISLRGGGQDDDDKQPHNPPQATTAATALKHKPHAGQPQQQQHQPMPLYGNNTKPNNTSNGEPSYGGLSAAELEQLKSEKKFIKRKLFNFMSDFKDTHGREVKSREDRAPLAAEYERYRHLKTVLQGIEGGA
eukprot:TRINITY_DN190_c3_g1_i1.p1 TRINITY_DN190_c3_g1~~TRINITY_DN190_c3_g1_i1.p1  ORF type:complete len:373 (+),score=78.26 TRINITY_DN190_c3_g1_i1:110-1120(+)